MKRPTELDGRSRVTETLNLITNRREGRKIG